MRSIDLYLHDIQDAAKPCVRFTHGMSYDAFISDEVIQSAVVRQLEIIGEASKQIPAHFRASHLYVPWSDMRDMRNRLIHAYFGIDYDIVWETVRDDLPALLPILDRLLAEFDKADK